MSEVIIAALITGGLGFLGVVLTLLCRQVDERERARLRAELKDVQVTLEHLRSESERYKAAYLGLLEITQGLLGEFEVS